MNNELTFSEKELEEAIRSLNSKKAPDVYGLTAEHLKYGDSTLVNYLTELLNNICKADSGVKPLCSLCCSSSTISLILLRNRNSKHLPITGSTVIPL
jgi:hypothetical protein